MTENGPADALRAVETLASAVKPPAPPRSLRPGAPLRWRPLAGAAAILAVAAGWWLLRDRPSVPEAPSTVIVEYMRVAGKPVAIQIVELPEARAIVVTPAPAGPDRNRHGNEGAEDGQTVESADVHEAS